MNCADAQESHQFSIENWWHMI